MRPKSNTIELNGKRYDAKTGKMITGTKAVKPGSKPAAKKSGVGSNIDGFSRRPKAVVRTTGTAPAMHRRTEKSKTLMRSVVKKPTSVAAKQVTPAIKKSRPSIHVDIDPKRVSRSKTVHKSPMVSKFGRSQKSVRPVTTALPVKPAPSDPPALKSHSKANIAEQSSVHKKAIQKALEGATGHKQPKAKKTTRRQRLSRKLRVSNRTVNIAAASLAIMLLIGFVAYQNIPNLSMQLATARAGVNGTLPGYQPSGFGLAGPIQYQSGQIVLNYASRSDNRQFKVSQSATQWNSETLQENFLASDQKTYQTFQNSGKTIYIYDDNNATWVDGGVWYQIEGNSALNSDQLLRMAASM